MTVLVFLVNKMYCYLLYDDVFVDDVYVVDVKLVLLTLDDFGVFDVVLFLYQDVDVLDDDDCRCQSPSC